MGSDKKVGIQLFSLPRLLSEDFEAGIKLLSDIGYRELELYGPFPFSDRREKENWSRITPMLGFSGSGYFSRDIREVKRMLDDYGMKTPAMHTDLFTLENAMGELAEAANVLGQKYVILPAVPQEIRNTLDDYKQVAEWFNNIGREAIKYGIRFAYHNHGYGIKPMGNQVPLHIIFDLTDPELVFFEMDIFWTTAGGADPVSYLNKYPNRYKLLHLKDMSEKKEFTGDGGDPSQWISLFPYMTTAGNGLLDVASVIRTAKEQGVEHFFVEQDMVQSPEIALKQSFDFVHREL